VLWDTYFLPIQAYGAFFIASTGNLPAAKLIPVCRDKGKPAAKRVRKAYGPALLRREQVARLPNGGGVSSSRSDIWLGY
jgi:hypothetical protein